MHTAAKPNYE
jgi:hypothetical protein